MKRIIDYGKHAADGARRENQVTLTVCIEPSEYYDPKTKKHYTKGEYFSVCGDIWNRLHTDIIRGGQCVDYIVKNFTKDKDSKNIRALWEVFHLQQLDLIPERFRAALVAFVNGATDNVPLERKACAAYLLKVTEKYTDYGTYTDGTITITTPDGLTEVITLAQGDEMKNPISGRAHTAINWLYDNAPSEKGLAETAQVDTNAASYAQRKEQERLDGLATIRAAAQRIIEAIDSGEVGEKWSVARMEIKSAEKFLIPQEEGESKK